MREVERQRPVVAIDAVAPFLRDEDVRVRRAALLAVTVSTWMDDQGPGVSAKSTAALRRKVRALIAGLILALPNIYGSAPAVQLAQKDGADVTSEQLQEFVRVVDNAGIESEAGRPAIRISSRR